MSVLVIEDEPKVAALIRSCLESAGFGVVLCNDGVAGLAQARTGNYEALVLDIMVPRLDGLEVLKRLRDEGVDLPTVLLTARGDPEDRIRGLNLGADDYLPKPFHVAELVARLKAVLRRGAGGAGTMLACSDLTLHPGRREVRRGGALLDLSPREFALLEFLLRREGAVASREEISRSVWNHHFDGGTNVVDVAIQRLRRKVDEPFRPRLIHTVRGMGYMLREEG